jgi:hypothetical protein
VPTKFAGVKGIGLPAQLKPERLVVRIHPPVPRAGLMQQADMLHSKRSFSRFESEGRHQSLKRAASKVRFFPRYPKGAMRNRNHLGGAKALRINMRDSGNRNAVHFVDAEQWSTDASGDAVLPPSLRAGSHGLASAMRETLIITEATIPFGFPTPTPPRLAK